MQGLRLDNTLSYINSFPLVRPIEKKSLSFSNWVNGSTQLCTCSPTHRIKEPMLSLMKQYVQRLPQESLAPLNLLNEGAARF